MRYFFLAYALVALLVVGIFGIRGQKFSKPPIRIFPDMDTQDKVKAQKPDEFFANDQGARLPVAQTQPRGLNPEGLKSLGGIPEYEFSGQTGYYYTGHIGDYFGSGMPEELKLTEESAQALIERGEERYGIYCAVCHGKSGNGQGITNSYGVPGIANFHLDTFNSESYPDGRMFETITLGKGMMGGYGYNISVGDRWAIIAYVRTLQAAKLAQPKAQ
ncbi:MAG: c-type cytochrome [Akkermansiaceae bacterium]|jgi:mono/diheme cytochrome c family protein|nr:c-type cytochrome [Akkermansiaceae bacterium]MBJ7423605.1 c-type cytochrome [Akkermansiaceae bacterium]